MKIQGLCRRHLNGVANGDLPSIVAGNSKHFCVDEDPGRAVIPPSGFVERIAI
jgi:hypothetical protein